MSIRRQPRRSWSALRAAIVGLLMTGVFVPVDSVVAADTAQAQLDKARATVQSWRQRGLTPPTSLSAGCQRADVIWVGHIADATGPTGSLLLVVFCRASLETIFALPRNELRQETLTLALAAMSTGNQVFLMLENGMIGALAAASGAPD